MCARRLAFMRGSVAAGVPLVVFVVGSGIVLGEVMRGRLELDKARKDELSKRASPSRSVQSEGDNTSTPQLDPERELQRLQPQQHYDNKPVPGK